MVLVKVAVVVVVVVVVVVCVCVRVCACVRVHVCVRARTCLRLRLRSGCSPRSYPDVWQPRRVLFFRHGRAHLGVLERLPVVRLLRLF
jgi:hypothetical protein